MISKQKIYKCDEYGRQLDTERQRSNIYGKLTLESGTFDIEKHIDVDKDLCADCLQQAINHNQIKIQIESPTDIKFE